MNEWHQTHVVPDGGMWVWATADPAAPPHQQLAPRTPVQVVETTGAWSRVRCDNGFSGWVDDRKLVPLTARPAVDATPPAPLPSAPGPPPTWAPSPTGPPPRRGWGAGPLVVVMALLGAAVVAAIVALDAGGDDDDSTSGAGVEVGAAATGTRRTTVELHLPPGWVSSADGRSAAENADDLRVAAPTGPAVRAVVIDTGPSAVSPDLLGFAGDLSDVDLTVEPPQPTVVDGFDAVSVVVRSPAWARILVAVHPPHGDAVVFRIDAPVDRFDGLRPVLDSIPGVAA